MNEAVRVDEQGVYQIGELFVDQFGLDIYKETVEALMKVADRAFTSGFADMVESMDEDSKDVYTEEAIEEINLIAALATHQIVRLIKQFSKKQVI